MALLCVSWSAVLMASGVAPGPSDQKTIEASPANEMDEATRPSRIGLLPWPAEPVVQAVNLTAVEGTPPNDFYLDLSGAVWNPVTRRLWVCRNGPAGQSKLWALVENGGGFQIDYQGPLRGEWTGFGDFEGVTQADFADPTVFGIIEGEERIREFDVSTYGTHALLNEWNTSGCLPGEGGEGITFVPDAALATAGFLDHTGTPYTSQRGMNGLMFVGHQEFGRIYVFDLERNAGPAAFTVVGEYATDFAEIAGLEFDRSTGLLYVWHDSDFDALTVLDLSSNPIAGQPACSQVSALRRFNTILAYDGPGAGNYEGIAIVSRADCDQGARRLMMTVDDGAAGSLFMFQGFAPGCETAVPATSAWSVTILGLLLAMAASHLILHRPYPHK